MESLKQQLETGEGLHHAYMLSGDREENLEFLEKVLRGMFGGSLSSNPDVRIFSAPSMGVLDAREFASLDARASFEAEEGKKFFLISTGAITHEAQNALLKVFEEPRKGTHFFLLIPQASHILPTLRSRVVHIEGRKKASDQESAQEFLKSSLEKRFALVKKLTEPKKKGEPLDREKVMVFIENLERELSGGERGPSFASIMKEFYMVKQSFASRGSSPKMLLEHLSVVLPLG